MIQDKLFTIIDTLAGVVAQDRMRIHSLEIEISKLHNLLDQRNVGSYPAPATPPVTAPSRGGYTAPPPLDYSAHSAESTPSTQTPPPSSPVNEKYSAALKLFNDGKYMDALTSFDELVRTDGNSDYAPNYAYWKGESLYALSQYDEAIRTFHDLLNKYPSSNKADDAEYKIGTSYEKLGDKMNAATAYQRLILSYPQSEYRARAESRLNKLK